MFEQAISWVRRAAIVVIGIVVFSQLAYCKEGVDGDESSDDHWSEAILPHDRESVRRYRQISELIDERQFSDAVVLLDRVLAATEDSFFHTADNKRQFRSLKSEALHKIRSLPPEGMATYRLQFGARAKKMLRQAIATGRIAILEEVSRRYFHTKAGYEATLLLGRYHLDNGRPLQAAISFQQLLDTPDAKRTLGVTLSVLTAASWARAGMEDHALETISSMLAEQSSDEVRIGGRQIELAGNAESTAESMHEWLTSVVGEQSREPRQSSDQWITFRGNAARNAASDGGRPLLSPRWRQRTANDPAVEKIVQQIRDDYTAQNIAAMPVLQPLALGDAVLMRTAQKLVAVDFQTGRRIWEARPISTDSVTRALSANHARLGSRGRGNHDREVQMAMMLDQRLWGDAIHGGLSSDGERVYLIRDLASPMQPAHQVFAMGGRMQIRVQALAARGPLRLPIAPLSNRLSALDLRTEGKLIWELGGPNPEAPELHGAFFLGAPLAVSAQLYCLAEIKSGIRLLVLDAKTGKFLWSQQLADIERDIAHNPLRRLAGASPSLADGILVCPTSAGAVVAVDLTKRSLLWAYQYPQQVSPRGFGFRMGIGGSGQNRSDSRWADSSAIIAEGHVLLTPIEAKPKRIYCLNLLDGSLAWQHDQDESLFVACIHAGNVILVGRTNITAIELRTGKTVWEQDDCPLPEGSLPSGRGFYADAHYYLPLSTKEVVKIDLDQGEIVDRSKSPGGIVPGNLICHRGSILSLGPDSLDAFYQIEPLRQRVRQALAKNPDDAEALLRQGELALDEDDLEAAIASFRRSYELVPDESTRDQFVESMLRGLESDFATHGKFAEELDSLVKNPSMRARLYRLLARGMQSAGRRREAFDAYGKLIDLGGDASQMVRDGANRTVRLDRWVESQLLSLMEEASADERLEIETILADRKAAFGSGAKKTEIQHFLDFFGDMTDNDDLRQRLAVILLSEGDLLKCERILHRLESSPDVARRGAATALMASLLRRAGQADHAARYYHRLSTEFAEQVCLDGKTGTQLMAALPVTDPARSVPDRWPRGKVKVQKIAKKGNVAQLQFTPPFELRGTLHPFFTGITVALDVRQRVIVGRDGYGKERFRAELGQVTNANIGIPVNVRTNVRRGIASGHLLVCSLGTRVVAVDTLSAENLAGDRLLWQRDLQFQALVPRSRTGFRVQLMQGAGGIRRAVVANVQTGDSVGSLGPVLRHGVTMQRGRDVVCVDPMRGKDVWVLEDMEPGSTLFGDDDILFIVPPPNATDAAVEAMVVDPRNGRPLGSRPVPPATQRLALVGRHVLQFSEVGNQVELKLVDPWQKRNVWKRTFEAYSRVHQVDGESVAVMQRSGKFQLLSIDDASARIDTELRAEPSLTSIRFQKFRDQYLLLAAVPPSKTDTNDRMTALDGSGDLFTGHIYAFDRKDGRSLWTTPAQVRLKGLLASQPSDLPILTFAELHTRKKRKGQRVTSVSLLCLDKRTGRPVFEKTGLSSNDRRIVLECNPEEKTITVSMRSGMYRLSFTNEPLASELPFQEDVERPPATEEKSSILEAIFGSNLRPSEKNS